MLSVNLQSLPPWRSQLYCAHISYSLGRSILRTVNLLTDDGVPGGANGLGLEGSNISFRLELRRGRMRSGGRWRWMGTERSRLGSESVSGRAWLADIFSYVFGGVRVGSVRSDSEIGARAGDKQSALRTKYRTGSAQDVEFL